MISFPDGVERVAVADSGDQHAAPSPKLIRGSKRSLVILRNYMSPHQKLV
jgi:hypothetical protein